MVLLVVDTQKAITNSELYQFELFQTNIKKLIHKARQNHIEVIFVRHDDGIGNELTKGNDGFEIYEVWPATEEKPAKVMVIDPYLMFIIEANFTEKELKELFTEKTVIE